MCEFWVSYGLPWGNSAAYGDSRHIVAASVGVCGIYEPFNGVSAAEPVNDFEHLQVVYIIGKPVGAKENSISGLKPIQKPTERAKLPGRRRAIRHRINMPRNGRLRCAFPHFNIRKNISSRNARLRQTISFLCNLRGLGPAEVPVNSSAHFPSKNGSERRAPRHGIRRRESNLLKYREERPRHSAPNLLSTSR